MLVMSNLTWATDWRKAEFVSADTIGRAIFKLGSKTTTVEPMIAASYGASYDTADGWQLCASGAGSARFTLSVWRMCIAAYAPREMWETFLSTPYIGGAKRAVFQIMLDHCDDETFQGLVCGGMPPALAAEALNFLHVDSLESVL